MELHHLTATKARELFDSKELSPVELLDAVVARTAAVEPAINALTEQMLELAYDAARASQERFATNGATLGALEGIPLLLKEEQPIAGYTAEEGSLLAKGNIAEATHPIVERIFAAGAVVHGRTTTPEFCCAGYTHSKLWGVTRNPWNLEMTPGGSSGGSGAALAAGETILATGSDIGGSIRIPASFNGLVGFKPPFGRVPGMAPFNQDTYCADGPMGRSVADVAMLQNVIAGPHHTDQASVRPAYVLGIPKAEAAQGMRVALCVNLGDYAIEPAVEANTRAAAEALRNAGVTVDEVTLPWTRKQLVATAWAHFGGIMGAFISEISRGQQKLLMPYTRSFAKHAAEAGSFAEGLVSEAELYAPLGKLLESYDALLCPTNAAQGLAADFADPEGTIEINGQQVSWLESALTLPFNVVGRVPVLAVPSGIAPNGVPTGVQIVGRTYDDATVFTLGQALEESLGLWNKASWWPQVNAAAKV
ncbi:amidase [Paeniglutamicibacter psychrophenolicus]|uniref:Aspartyl-tRNA(Asn)/glutamyl-tRNA(Gln) amidotransferase subunit A n=1 Tax=Paeniglutamicibacter psychrophenolicus TaxID=257454 RepID=A0ABS4W9P9_9MICC|nr:amidase [Paeniglutamicibacter psychrophenolicus]MBP2372936.1 aspartyl-tRNA(Asn)/glutamyl-tRNA(Gln) amidotransferase subunit A [Paeniglutamicibacter psychrophenolicus]